MFIHAEIEQGEWDEENDVSLTILDGPLKGVVLEIDLTDIDPRVMEEIKK